MNEQYNASWQQTRNGVMSDPANIILAKIVENF
jgi:hypothetical protein